MDHDFSEGMFLRKDSMSTAERGSRSNTFSTVISSVPDNANANNSNANAQDGKAIDLAPIAAVATVVMRSSMLATDSYMARSYFSTIMPFQIYSFLTLFENMINFYFPPFFMVLRILTAIKLRPKVKTKTTAAVEDLLERVLNVQVVWRTL